MYYKLSILLIASALISTTGCSISNSLQGISNSISSPFESSSGSSGESTAYREDVSDLTVAYVQSGGDLDAYRLGVTALAKNRGISNWEEDSFTCASIGFGLKRAEFDEAGLQEFASNLFGSDADKLRQLQSGYDLPPGSVE